MTMDLPRDSCTMTIFTIGHSNHPFEKFLEMLKAHEVRLVADVRTIPRSRHNPQFNIDILPSALQAEGIGYHHLPALGGLRHPKKDSLNCGWEHDSFRGFADYMQTEGFAAGLSRVDWRWDRNSGLRSCAPRRCPGDATGRSSPTRC